MTSRQRLLDRYVNQSALITQWFAPAHCRQPLDRAVCHGRTSMSQSISASRSICSAILSALTGYTALRTAQRSCAMLAFRSGIVARCCRLMRRIRSYWFEDFMSPLKNTGQRLPWLVMNSSTHTTMMLNRYALDTRARYMPEMERGGCVREDRASR